MAFKYALSAEQQTPTSDSKVVLAKSFRINIAEGAGFTTATAYTLGYIPKDAQVISAQLLAPTTVSGGTVSAATLAVTLNGNAIYNGVNVFAAASTGINATGYYNAAGGFQATTVDQKIEYTPTLTGAGATAGIIFITLLYVI